MKGAFTVACLVMVVGRAHAQGTGSGELGSDPISKPDDQEMGSDPISTRDGRELGPDPMNGGPVEHDATALTAHADDDRPHIHIEREHTDADRVPLLSLDPIVSSRLEGIAKTQQRDATTISYGNARVVLEGLTAENSDRVASPALDTPFRSWRAGARFTHSIGPLELEVSAGLGDMQSHYLDDKVFGVAGRYYDVGVALTYRRRLSRWMTAWISLGIGRRTWLGDPPPGEVKEATSATLTIGTTFR